jgi:hypothetical protein
MTKTVDSTLSSDVAGRIFLDEAPQEAEKPYVVFFIVSDVPEKTFTEDFENIIIQFSLFSDSEGAAEITTMYNDLKTLFDECTFSITASTLIWTNRVNLTTMFEDGVRHWAVDYEIKTSLD